MRRWFMALALVVAPACVSTDITQGLPCTADEQCGGDQVCAIDPVLGEACCGGICQSGTNVTMTAEDSGADSGDGTAGGDCFAPETGCPHCDPFTSDCSPLAGCYPAENPAQAPTRCASPPGEKPEGSDCMYHFECRTGLYCAASEEVEGCSGSFFCCTQLCDITAPNCPYMMQCVPLVDVNVPPEIGHVGKCVKG